MQITYQPTVSISQINRTTKRALFNVNVFDVRQMAINIRYHIAQIRMVYGGKAIV